MIPDLVTTRTVRELLLAGKLVLTTVLCEDVAPDPRLVGPETLDPGALSLPQPPRQWRVGVRLLVVVLVMLGDLGVVKVGRPSSRPSLLPLLSSHTGSEWRGQYQLGVNRGKK